MDELTCVVCLEVLDDYNVASCQFCGGKFHMPWDVRDNVRPCGHVVSHNEALAILFLCGNCYTDTEDEK